MGNRFNLEYDIPQNRLVEIIDGSKTPIFPQPLILNDEISIKIKSNYGQLWEASPNNFLNLLSSATEGKIGSGQFALQGAQIWKSTDPINIDINVSLEMDKDPYNDVIVPTFLLMQRTTPSINTTSGFITTAVESVTNLKLQTLIPPGPNFQALAKLMKNGESVGDKLLNDETNNGVTAKGVFKVKVGFVTFFNVIITGVEPLFSKTVAPSTSKGGKLFPIGADLSLSMSTMEIATSDMLQQMLNSF